MDLTPTQNQFKRHLIRTLKLSSPETSNRQTGALPPVTTKDFRLPDHDNTQGR